MTHDWFTLAVHQADRFWSKVSRSDREACWSWNAGVDKNGYGKFQITLPSTRINDEWKNPQKHVRAHRLAYMLLNGYTDKLIRHTCDNARCCNPHHLLPGTQLENRRDCVTRGRQPHGETSATAKLTSANVLKIRSMKGKVSAVALAHEHFVSRSTIYFIWSGRNWKNT